jgi:hypothetical protein
LQVYGFASIRLCKYTALQVPTDIPSANRLFHHTPVTVDTAEKDVFTDTAGADGGTICPNE